MMSRCLPILALATVVLAYQPPLSSHSQSYSSFLQNLAPASFLDHRHVGIETPLQDYGNYYQSGPSGSGPEAPAEPAEQACGLAPPFCTKSKYRSLDGSCNNLKNPVWGVAQTPYGRLLPAKYGDGISSFPRSSSGRELPLVRLLSLILFPDREVLDSVWTLNAMQWGQIITHDMSLTAGNTQSHKHPTRCCTSDNQFLPRQQLKKHCNPIVIPEDDPVMGVSRIRCKNFVRTLTTRDRNCVGGYTPAEQITAVTAYMDLSLVYGNSPTQHAPIRSGIGGRLLTENRQGRQYPPQNPNATTVCDNARLPGESCYLTGDIRTNQNPQLAILQIVLLREHNRLADALANLNPHWDDETIFQEARRIAVAEYQHINYYEWLPIFLGYENSVKNGIIYPGAHSYVDDYSPSVDPAVLNEHATAAFRYLHTLIAGQLALVTEERTSQGTLRLSDWVNRPAIIESGNTLDLLSRGLATQRQEKADQFFDSEITQFFNRQNQTFGNDLRSIDIQRDRDHGLTSYNNMREACGLPRARTFKDLTDVISPHNVQLLSSQYETPDDIDLTVGGGLESLVAGALSGPTFLCIMTEQFFRTRKGDRFFYENGNDKEIAFTPQQLTEIRKASISRLMCDNSDFVSHMQPRGFAKITESNQPLPCQLLPVIDLSHWKDAGQQSDYFFKK